MLFICPVMMNDGQSPPRPHVTEFSPGTASSQLQRRGALLKLLQLNIAIKSHKTIILICKTKLQLQHEAMSLLRTALRKTPRLSLAPAAIIHRATSKSYATHSSSTNTPTHRRVTVFNDTGRVNWGELSAREKAARTTQQTFNLALVIVGAALVVSDVPIFLFLSIKNTIDNS